MDTLPKKRPSGPLGKKPNVNAYSDMLKEMKKKYQPKAYAKSEAVKKAREDYRNSPEAREDFKQGLADFTPYGIYHYGKKFVKDPSDIESGIITGLYTLPFVGGALKKGYQGLKGLFKGPLSPQYNSAGAVIKQLSKFFDHPMNVAVRKNKPEFKDVEIYYTGQNPAVAKQMKEGKTKGEVFFSDNPEVAKEYAGPQGVIMGFGAKTPITGKRSIIDKNMGYSGGQTQYILSPEESIKFMKNPNFQMPFAIFSDPLLTRR